MKVYLAGPEVFLPDARDIGRRKTDICARYGLEGHFPLDADVEAVRESAQGTGEAIYRANMGLIQACDAIIANITPFRGPGADPGTAFEMGVMRAAARPVFAYSNVAADHASRVAADIGAGPAADYAADGLFIERFGMTDNLMLDGAVLESGAAVVAEDAPATARFADLTAFERCVAQARAHLLGAGA